MWRALRLGLGLHSSRSYIDLMTLTLVWRGPTGKRVPTLMSVDRRDSATLISIGTLPPAGSLRIGTQRGNGEGGKVELKRRVGNKELRGASIETTHQGYSKRSRRCPCLPLISKPCVPCGSRRVIRWVMVFFATSTRAY
jgi:hypothetical protein